MSDCSDHHSTFAPANPTTAMPDAFVARDVDPRQPHHVARGARSIIAIRYLLDHPVGRMAKGPPLKKR